jgi:hypothetical protein
VAARGDEFEPLLEHRANLGDGGSRASADGTTGPLALSAASREEVLDEARAAPQHKPAVTYDIRGKLLGVIDILKRTPAPPTRYDRPQFCVYDGVLFIVPSAYRPCRVDERLHPPEVQRPPRRGR